MLFLKLLRQFVAYCLMAANIYFHCLVHPVNTFTAIFGFHSHRILLTHRFVNVILEFVDLFLENCAAVCDCFDDLGVEVTFEIDKLA